jgi:hypothetical protein
MKEDKEQKGTFKKVDHSENHMYGPRALLICGYPAEEHHPFVDMLEKIGLAGVRAVFATAQDLTSTVGDLLLLEDKTGFRETSPMQRAVIMSGLTQKELHVLMGVYGKVGLPSQLWATLTPVSEGWPLGALLEELEAERRAMSSGEK